MKTTYIAVIVIIVIILLLAGFLSLRGSEVFPTTTTTPPITTTETELGSSLKDMEGLTDGILKLPAETEIEIEEFTEETFELKL
ncbi:MAG: hypothetical protein GTN36_00225 [Candidatus Aenigmarchaeota archaeon]|nr:hypothetical protein [Candidatus Aenigmarchaeota archaeon]